MLALAGLSPIALRAQTLPSADEVVAKYVTAIGGKEAIMKLTSLTQSALMEVPAAGLSVRMAMFAAAPNLVSTTTTIPGAGEMQNGYNGEVAWEVNPAQGARVLAGKELKVMIERADFYGSRLYSSARYRSMEIIGDTILAGERAFKVRMIAKESGSESLTLFSAVSGLVLGGTFTQESPAGTANASFTQGDYKRFGGVLMPTRTVISVGGQTMIMTIQDVVLNTAPASVFAMPAQVTALVKP